MVTLYCPCCWNIVEHNAVICPHCRADIPETLSKRDYASSLIAALSHHEPETPIRAATILGSLRASQAVAPLIRLVGGDADLYQKSAAIEALGQIGDPSAEPMLKRLMQEGPSTLRIAAGEAWTELRAQKVPRATAIEGPSGVGS